MRHTVDVSENAPWKERFRASSIRTSSIALRAPARGLIANNASGSLQWYAWDVPSGNLRQITHTPGGHPMHLTLSADGRYIYYLRDQQGNEIGHFVRALYEGGEPEDLTPDLPNYSASSIDVSDSADRLAFIAARDNRFYVYCIEQHADGSLEPARLIYESGRLIHGVSLSADGHVLVITSSERSGRFEFDLLAFDTTTGAQIASLCEPDGNSLELGPASHTSADSRFLATTTRSGIERLLIWDARSGVRTDLDLPEAPGAMSPFDWSPDGRAILFSTVDKAEARLYVHSLTQGETHAIDYGGGVVGQAYYTPDGAEILALWQDAASPSRLIALDPQRGVVTRTVLAAGNVPQGIGLRSVSFPSFDGQPVQAWLGVPEGNGPFPTILFTHGGPTAVQMNTFSAQAQAWLDHGYAFLSLNYHGSSTFGRDFERKIWGDLGHWEVEDMVAARAWLVDEGVAQPDAILLSGWSYGGYLTLMGLGKRPELWAGGMAGIAIADWFLMYEDQAEALRGYQRAIFGGTPEQKPEQHRASSPITYAADVSAPILVIQGRNDTRTPVRQMEKYEATLKALGKEITVHWYDTGHAGSFTDVQMGIDHTELMLRFAQRVLE